MTPTIICATDFAPAARFRTIRRRYRKALVGALVLAALFAARAFAFADDRVPNVVSFSCIKAESLLGFFFLNVQTLQPPGSSTGSIGSTNPNSKANLLEWQPDLNLAVVRTFDSLPLPLFQPHSTRFSRFEPGFGTYFPGDTIGRSRISGAGWEEIRWFYLKVKFRF